MGTVKYSCAVILFDEHHRFVDASGYANAHEAAAFLEGFEAASLSYSKEYDLGVWPVGYLLPTNARLYEVLRLQIPPDELEKAFDKARALGVALHT